MTGRWPVACAIWALGTAYAATCLGQPVAASGQPPLDQSVAALLQALQARGQLPPLDTARREQALAGLLKGLGIEATLPGKPRPSAVQEPITLKGLYAYIRIDHIGPALAIATREALADIPNGHYEAVILDLRATTGATATDLDQAFAILRKDPVPIVALLGTRSASAAAELATHLRQSHRAILVGQAPTPLPPVEELALPTGDRVWLPAAGPQEQPQVPPLELDIVVRDPHAATITFENADTENWDALAARDEGLRRAVDLLATMRALRQP